MGQARYVAAVLLGSLHSKRLFSWNRKNPSDVPSALSAKECPEQDLRSPLPRTEGVGGRGLVKGSRGCRTLQE